MFGRRYVVDQRDQAHPLRARVGPTVERRTITWALAHNRTMDQGNTGTCVGHGWKALLMGQPIARGLPVSKPTAFGIYRAAIPLDEWTDNDGEVGLPDAELQSGTSVRAGA